MGSEHLTLMSIEESLELLLKFFWKCEIIFFFFLNHSRATPKVYGGSQVRGPIRAAATGLHHSHSNAGSKPRLRPTLQLMAMPDP